MKPFDIQEALAHPERVVHRDGRKAVQVFYADKAAIAHQVIIVWESGAVFHYTKDGKAFASDAYCTLFLSTPPERVPFTVEGLKKGWEPIYRNGEKPLEVKVFEKMKTSQPVASLTEKQLFHWHSPDGTFWNDKTQSDLDLFLIKPATT